MPLILAIEPDRRQAARISSLARERLNVELLVVDSAERALGALKERTPDLILTPQLLSPKDEAALDERLRQLDAAGSQVQTLMIPVLASSGRRASGKASSLLNRLRRTKDEPVTEGGCDPAVFAAQITEYLEKAADERAAKAAIVEDERAYQLDRPVIATPAPVEALPEPVLDASEHIVFDFQQDAAPAIEPEYVPPQPPAAAIPEVLFAESPAAAIPEVLFATVPAAAIPEVFFAAAPAEPDVAQFDVPQVFQAPAPAQRETPDAMPAMSFPEFSSNRSFESDEIVESLEPMTARQAQPVLSVPAAFEDFVAFDELSVVDSPMVGFGELTAAIAHAEIEPLDLQAFEEELDEERTTTLEAMSVLDALEILDEPEIPVTVDFPVHERVQPPRRPSRVAATPVLDDESEPDPSPSDFDFESDLWMPLPVAAQRCWPALEGPTVKATFTPGFDAPADPDVEFAPPPSPEDRGSARKRKGKPYQDEWGFFDPVQCGFAALLAKLDEVTDAPDGTSEPAKATR